MRSVTLLTAVLGVGVLSCEPAPIAAPPSDDAPDSWEPVADFPKLPEGTELGRVLGVAIDADGRVWFSHMGAGDDRPQIVAVDPETGEVVGGVDASSLHTPHALAFDAAGLLWVTDDGGDRVVVFDRAGRIVRTIGGE